MKPKTFPAQVFCGALAVFLLIGFSAPVESAVPIIWDDDGSPDGVIALLYFLKNPEVSVKAITVSCGEAHPDDFARDLTRMLARIGRPGIPVAAGRSTPLVGENAFPEPWRKATKAFWGVDLPEPVERVHSMSAAQLIVDIVNQSSEPVTIFVSGNHTNLAEALRLDPTIINRIGRVEIMGGALHVRGNIESDWPDIHNRVAEWNIWVDPVAASEVFSTGLSKGLTPLDSTKKVIWKESDAATWEASGTPEGILAAELLRWMLRSWSPKGIFVWDLVAAVNATDPDLCQQEQVNVQVVTEPGDQQGRTVVDKSQPENTTACMKPKVEAVKKRVRQVFGLPK
jgi:pyrimidine-specific ribonucleoside hydrolase